MDKRKIQALFSTQHIMWDRVMQNMVIRSLTKTGLKELEEAEG